MEIIIRPIAAGDGKWINELRRMPGVFENILGTQSERIKRNEDFILNMAAIDRHVVNKESPEVYNTCISAYLDL